MLHHWNSSHSYDQYAGNFDRFREPLDYIDGSGREMWLKVGMALHYESGGGNEGYQLWTEWSQRFRGFDEKDQGRTWKSFKANGHAVTGGTLMKLAKDGGWRPCAHDKKGKQRKRWAATEAELIRQGYNVAAVYPYHDAKGRLLAEKVRFENPDPKPSEKPKTFRWRRQIGGEPYAEGIGSCPPYALSGLLEHADDMVFGVEGEKDANALNDLGLVAISIESGHEHTAAKYLERRDVIIIPDNDTAGKSHADKVKSALTGSAETVRLLQLPGLPDKGDVSDWLANGGTVDELLRLTEDAVFADAADALSEGLILLYEDAQLHTDLEELIDGAMPSAGVGMLYAPSYTGKTFVGLDVGLSVAQGIPFAGEFDTEQGAVAYVALEAPISVERRLFAHRQVHSAADVAFGILNLPLAICDKESVRECIDLLRKFQATLPGQRIRLVIIDTLAKAMAGRNENGEAMSQALQGMEEIQKAIGGCVMAIHHPGKNPDHGARGHSSLHAGCDFVWTIKEGDGDGVRKLHVEKLKDGEGKASGQLQAEASRSGSNKQG